MRLPEKNKVKVKLADGKFRTSQQMSVTSFWHPDGTPMSAPQLMESLHNQFNPKQQAFLDFVLSHDVSIGIEELAMKKLAPLLRLKYQVSILDTVVDLGEPASILEVSRGFQKFLYQPAA